MAVSEDLDLHTQNNIEALKQVLAAMSDQWRPREVLCQSSSHHAACNRLVQTGFAKSRITYWFGDPDDPDSPRGTWEHSGFIGPELYELRKEVDRFRDKFKLPPDCKADEKLRLTESGIELKALEPQLLFRKLHGVTLDSEYSWARQGDRIPMPFMASNGRVDRVDFHPGRNSGFNGVNHGNIVIGPNYGTQNYGPQSDIRSDIRSDFGKQSEKIEVETKMRMFIEWYVRKLDEGEEFSRTAAAKVYEAEMTEMGREKGEFLGASTINHRWSKQPCDEYLNQIRTKQ